MSEGRYVWAEELEEKTIEEKMRTRISPILGVLDGIRECAMAHYPSMIIMHPDDARKFGIYVGPEIGDLARDRDRRVNHRARRRHILNDLRTRRRK